MTLAHIQWNPDPELFNLFGISIRYYGLLFVSGLFLSVYVLKRIFKKENLPAEHVEKLATYGFIGVLAGARLGHCLFYEPEYYLSRPLEMLLPITFLEDGGFKFTGYAGLASHGGALGLIIALILYSRKTKHSILDAIDLIAIVTGIGAGFIRLANFMNSEIIGMPTDKPWGIIFLREDRLPRHPAQLYEAMCYFLIFGLMFYLYNKKRDQLKNGFFFGLVLALIFTARFFIEFIKENQVAFEDAMTFNMGQLLSLPYIAVGIGFMIYGLRKSKQQG